MVKPKGPVWKHWTQLSSENSTHPSVKCIYCSKIYKQGVAGRMQVHLNKKCPEAPDHAKTTLNITSAEEVSLSYEEVEVQADYNYLNKKCPEVPNNAKTLNITLDEVLRLAEEMSLPSEDAEVQADYNDEEFDNYDYKCSQCYNNETDEMERDRITCKECFQTNTRYYQYICLYESGNKVVDDFIRHTQVISLNFNMMIEFIPYDQFKDIRLIAEVESSKIYKATWVNGPILNWDDKRLNFRRRGFTQVVLKKLDNSENITYKRLNEVHINLYNLIKL